MKKKSKEEVNLWKELTPEIRRFKSLGKLRKSLAEKLDDVEHAEVACNHRMNVLIDKINKCRKVRNPCQSQSAFDRQLEKSDMPQ